MTAPNAPTQASIDPDRIAAIVRTVLEQLRTRTHANPVSSPDRVVSVATLDAVGPDATQIVVSPGAIITPAAVDEAKTRGIRIEFKDQKTPTITSKTQEPQNGITDRQDPDRGVAIAGQLTRRGVSTRGLTVICTDSPAEEVHRQCVDGHRAVMIQRICDVDRFVSQWNPNVWVLDMAQLNLISAVNTVARIAQRN